MILFKFSCIYKEHFRIKQRQSGLCWQANENNDKVVLSSRCRDTFLITDESKMIHTESKRFVSNTGMVLNAGINEGRKKLKK